MLQASELVVYFLICYILGRVSARVTRSVAALRLGPAP
jgi:hypothetical protein